MKILVPVDGSDISTGALKHALALAKRFSEPPKLLVIAVDDSLFPGAERKMGADAAAQHHAENHARMLAPARKALARGALDVKLLEVVGDVADSILQVATKEKVDLVVMGSRGNGALKGAFLGSVSTKVLAESGVPVTIVR